MKKLPSEAELRERLDRGRNQQSAKLLAELQEYHESHSELSHTGMMLEFYQIRTRLEEELISCQVSGNSADRSQGANVSRFLANVYQNFANGHFKYKEENLLTTLILHDITVCRKDHGTLPDPLMNDFCLKLRYATKWSDEDLIEWIGQYHYMVNDSYDEGKREIDSMYGVFPPLPNEVAVKHQVMDEDAIDDITAGENSKGEYPARSLVIFILSLLDEAVEGTSLKINIDALARLLMSINGKSLDNYVKPIKRWRNGTLAPNIDTLTSIKSDMDSLRTEMKFARLQEMLDAATNRASIPKKSR